VRKVQGDYVKFHKKKKKIEAQSLKATRFF